MKTTVPQRIARLLILAGVGFAGLVIAGLVLAAPASAGAGSDSANGGGSDPGMSDSGGRSGCPTCGGSGSAYTHDNTYTIVSTWDNRTNPDRNRFPTPMGYYNDDGRAANVRPFHGTNRTVGQETKRQWAAKGYPCRTNVSDSEVIHGERYNTLSLGASWDQNVHWKLIRGEGRMEISKVWITNTDCEGRTDIGGKWRYCPTEVGQPVTVGPWGTNLPGDVRTISYSAAARKPAVNTPGYPRWEPGARKDDFRRAWNRGTYSSLSVDEKIDRAQHCGSVWFDYNSPPVEYTANSAGFYTTIQPITGAECRWMKLGKSRLRNVTNVNATSPNPDTHTEVWEGETRFLGCDRKQPPSNVDHAMLRCVKNDAGGADPDFPYMLRRYEDVDPRLVPGSWWLPGCSPEPAWVTCEVRNDPTITVTGLSQWGATINKRDTTLMADGKQASIRWPEPTLFGDHVDKVRSKQMDFNQSAVNGRLAYPDVYGHGTSDPFSSDFALNGTQVSGWDNPLNLRFYRPPAASTSGSDVTPGKVKVSATYRFEAPTVIPIVDFNPSTGWGYKVGDRIDYADAVCDGTADAEFWVATTRPTN